MDGLPRCASMALEGNGRRKPPLFSAFLCFLCFLCVRPFFFRTSAYAQTPEENREDAEKLSASSSVPPRPLREVFHRSPTLEPV
jgi:hypothetical protein